MQSLHRGWTYCSQDWFSHKGIVKISTVFQISCSDQEKDIFTFTKHTEKIQNLTKNDNLRGGGRFLLNCSCITWPSPPTFTNTCGDARSSWRWPQQIKHWILTRQRLLLQNFLTESKHPHNSLSDCPWSLVWIDVLKHLQASCRVQAPQST